MYGARMQLDLLCIADDLTGACDAGALLSSRGIPCVLLCEHAGMMPNLENPVRAVVVNTDSRHVAPAEAARRVRAAIESTAPLAPRWVFKKTDSTLRGNPGCEIEAAALARGARNVWFVPAYPSAGRTVRDGVLCVDGVPVADSAFGSDPRSPVGQSRLARALSAQSRLTVLDGARAYDPPECDAEAEAQIVAPDATCEQDMRTAAANAYRRKAMCAGSVGFLAAMLDMWRLRGESCAVVTASGPVVVACGSLNPVSRAQVAWAVRNGMHLVVSAEHVSDSSIQTVRELVMSGQDVAVATNASLDVAGESALRALACTVKAGLEGSGRADAVVMALGGETAQRVFSELGIATVIPRGVVADGVSVVEPLCADVNVSLIVTKSGGFGHNSIIGDLLRYLRSRS